MNDAQKFAYRVQGALAFFLVCAVVGLAYLLILVHIQLSQTLEALLNTAVGAMIAWGGSSVAFWLSRHRSQQSDGSDDSNPTPVVPVPTSPAAPAKVNP